MSTSQPTENSLTFERRTQGRRRVLLSCIQLGENNGGIVLNISETGLALRAAEALADDEFTAMRFQLSQSSKWVEAQGRVTWRGAANKAAGIEFVDLNEEGRNEIRAWMSGFVSDHPKQLGSKLAVMESAALPATVVSIDSNETSASDNPVVSPMGGQQTSASPNVLSMPETSYGHEYSDGEDERPSYKMFLLFAAFLVVALLLLMIGNRVRWMQKANTGEATAGAARPAGSSASSIAANQVSDPALALNLAHFALQVGAMTRQENALALADELQLKKFPALVFRAKDDRFFRVFVGPYDDADSAARVGHDLKSQGFASIPTEWPVSDK